MKIKLVAYGIARDILETSEYSFTLNENSSIGELKELLIKDYPKFQDLRSLRFAVNEEYQTDHYLLHEKDEVIIIPPVSGG